MDTAQRGARPRVRKADVTPRRSQSRQSQADKTDKRAATPPQPARPPADGLWTIEEVRSFLRVGKRKVYDYVHQGLLAGFRAGRGYRFTRGDVEALMDHLRAAEGAGGSGGAPARRDQVTDDVRDDTHPELAAVRR